MIQIARRLRVLLIASVIFAVSICFATSDAPSLGMPFAIGDRIFVIRTDAQNVMIGIDEWDRVARQFTPREVRNHGLVPVAIHVAKSAAAIVSRDSESAFSIWRISADLALTEATPNWRWSDDVQSLFEVTPDQFLISGEGTTAVVDSRGVNCSWRFTNGTTASSAYSAGRLMLNSGLRIYGVHPSRCPSAALVDRPKIINSSSAGVREGWVSVTTVTGLGQSIVVLN